ncbi:MAG: TVP38/TMEM64 family protein [Clostridia bacterium]|nr:TVP38/TMEM64 family protein [Clostridia bacterium]
MGILVAIYYIGKSYGWFGFFESADSIKNYVSSFGPLAPLIFFLLQFAQVIISPIPGNITTIVGGVMFGFVNGFLISFAAVFLGSICAFLLGKKFGRPLVERIAGKKNVDKYMVSVSSRQKIVLFLMFLFPFFPDDILCLVAGLTAMRLPYFAVLVLVTRPFGLLFSALLGAGIISMPIWAWAIIIVVVIILFAFSIKYAPQIEERTKGFIDKIAHRVKR